MRAARVSQLAIVLALTAFGCAGPGAVVAKRADRVPDRGGSSSGRASTSANRPGPGTLLPRLVVGESELRVDADTPVAFSPDDALLALGSSSGLVRLLDAATGAPLEALRGHDAEVTLLVDTPAGGMLSGDRAGELVLWRPGARGWLDATPTVLASRHRTAITAASFAADGTTMVSADSDGNALLWDMTGPRVVAQLDESEDSGDGVTVGRGAASHYVVSADGKLALGWTVASTFVRTLPSGQPTRRLYARGRVLHARARGSGFAVTLRDKFGATVCDQIDASGRRVSTTVVAAPGVEPLGEGHTLRREARRFSVARSPAQAPVLTLELAPSDEHRLIVSGAGARALLVTDAGTALIDVAGGTARVRRAERGALGWPRAIATVGPELLVADGSRVHVFDRVTGAMRGRLPLATTRLVAAPDGRRWAGAGTDSFVVDAVSRELLFEAAGDELSAVSADLSLFARREGSQIVLLTADGGGTEVARFALGERYPTLLAFSPDSRSLLVADANGQLDRFDAKTGVRELSQSTDTKLEAIVGWRDGAILAAARTAGRASVLVQLDPATLAVVARTPAGESVAQSPSGGWTAWMGKAGVRVRKTGGPVFALPDRLGEPTVVAFDAVEPTLYVGRPGTVELWALDDLEASRTGETVHERQPLLPPAATAAGHDRFGDPLPVHARLRFGTTRGALGSEVEDIQPLGDHLWLIGSWGRATRWDPIAGASLRRIESEGTAGDRNTFLTADEQWLVSRGTQSLGVWSVATGERTATVERPDAKDDASALSPRGDRFVIGTETGELRIYAVPSLDLVHAEPRAHAGRIEALSYAPDGKLFASCGRFGVIRLNDAATGAVNRTIVGPNTDEYSGCSAVAFSPDGRTLYADLSGLQAFEVATGRPLGEFAGWEGNLSQIAVSPNGDVLAFGRHHDPATVWDARRRTKIATIETADGGSAVAFSTNGAELWVGGSDGVPRAFDTKTWSEVRARPVHGRIASLVVTEGGRVLVTADQSGQLRSWDTATGASLGARVVESYPSLAVTDTALWVQSGGILAVDPRTLGDVRPRIDASGGHLAVSADGRLAALVDGHRLGLVDLQTSTATEISWDGGYVDAVAVDPKGRLVAAGGTNGAVRWFGPTGAELGGGRARAPVRSLVFSPSEDVVFVCARQEGSSPAYVALEVPSGKPRWRLEELAFSASDALGVSADGRLVVFADHEAIHLLDSRSGAELGTIPTEGAAGASALVFSPDRKTLYVSSARTVLAWDVSFVP